MRSPSTRRAGACCRSTRWPRLPARRSATISICASREERPLNSYAIDLPGSFLDASGHNLTLIPQFSAVAPVLGVDFDATALGGDTPSDYLQFSGAVGDVVQDQLDAAGLDPATWAEGSATVEIATLSWNLGAIVYDTQTHLDSYSGTQTLSFSQESISDPIVTVSFDIDRFLEMYFFPTTLLPNATPNNSVLAGAYNPIGDAHIIYDLLQASLDFRVHLAQRQSVTVNSTQVTVTASTGETQTAALGDTLSFTTPSGGEGTVDFDVDYTMSGTVQTDYGYACSIVLPYDFLSVMVGWGDVSFEEGSDGRIHGEIEATTSSSSRFSTTSGSVSICRRRSIFCPGRPGISR